MDEMIEAAVEEAAKKRIEVISNQKDEAKSIKGEFVDFMVGSLPKKESKEIRKQAKADFSTIMKYRGDENKEKLAKLCKTISTLLKYGKYMGDDTVSDTMSNLGIDVSISSSILDENPQIDGNSPENMSGIFDDAEKIVGSVNAANEEIAACCPVEFAYSKDNPRGMKKSDFSRLVNAKAMESIKKGKDYTDFLTKVSEASIFAIEREKNVQEGLGAMFEKFAEKE